MLHRLILDDIRIKDQNNKMMLTAPRISVKLNIIDLLNGDISISSAQIFGMKADLYKKNKFSKPNFQFILDSLSSKKPKENKKFNLKISSLIIRRSSISYNQLDEPVLNKFSFKHLDIKNISAHVILNKLTNDSINVNIKKIALKEKSGLVIKKLSLKLDAGKTKANLTDMHLSLLNSDISVPNASANYVLKDKKLVPKTLRYNLKLDKSIVTLYDFAFFYNIFKNYKTPINLSFSCHGTDKNANISKLALRQDQDVDLSGGALILKKDTVWGANVTLEHLRTTASGIRSIAANLGNKSNIPIIIDNLGKIDLQGKAKLYKQNITIESLINTDLGAIKLMLNKINNKFISNVSSKNFNISSLTENPDFGIFKGLVSINGELINNRVSTIYSNSIIEEFTYKKHNYKNAVIKASLTKEKLIDLALNINDEAGEININSNFDISEKSPSADFNIHGKKINLSQLGILDKSKNNIFSFDLSGHIRGKDLNSSIGDVYVNDFSMTTDNGEYRLKSLQLHKLHDASGNQRITLKSDFLNLEANGIFNYNTIVSSLISAVSKRLSTMPGLPKTKPTNNQINLYATIKHSDWFEKLLGIPIKLEDDAHLIANVNDISNVVDINFDIPNFTYKKKTYRDGYVRVTSPNGTLSANINIKSENLKGEITHLMLDAKAIDNHLTSKLHFIVNGRNKINGELNTDANFFKKEKEIATAQINILRSEVLVGDTVWNINPSTIEYSKDNLSINNFSINHSDQEIRVDGVATKSTDDLIKVKLQDVNIAYILDILNFHSVDFAGNATGNADIKSLYSTPSIEAKLNVDNFSFEEGYLGKLFVDANWDNDLGAINIDAKATEENDRFTIIKGFVSPKNKSIDLKISAKGSNLNFLKKYTNSFASDINLKGFGNIEVVGPFSKIELVGDAKVSGNLKITPLNTTYSLDNARVRFNPDDIILSNDTIHDRNGNIGTLNGHLRHNHLNNFSFDIVIDANNVLSYDTHDFGNDVFYGTVYSSGKCNIKGNSGEIVIDVDAIPNKNSQIVYNATSPTAISNSEFIHWNDKNSKKTDVDKENSLTAKKKQSKIGTNVYLNMLINCNPEATIKVLMDNKSGDYISLNGTGVIRAAYYNRGTFELFGNYLVDHGVYKLTIQDVIKRDFNFLPGGTIAFGGDAFKALLNLQAQYTLNSVSLSDINLGKTFSNNNIRVNCLMNITGTPMQPRVDFTLDMPTVSSDAKQMIMSVMNSTEEMNQQVLYLLAVGRFLNQENNSSSSQTQRQSQTSLAMQSILSGTISQQLSNILENVVGNNKWNLGANISTGDEGFNNAEYEGLFSGHLLNNRLLINGQFGYRDKPYSNSTFIGDFDIRYLLVPSGSAAIKVYNQTNDKYFTKNSLNTQGIGLIFKKDFNGWQDFFKRKKMR